MNFNFIYFCYFYLNTNNLNTIFIFQMEIYIIQELFNIIDYNNLKLILASYIIPLSLLDSIHLLNSTLPFLMVTAHLLMNQIFNYFVYDFNCFHFLCFNCLKFFLFLSKSFLVTHFIIHLKFIIVYILNHCLFIFCDHKIQVLIFDFKYHHQNLIFENYFEEQENKLTKLLNTVYQQQYFIKLSNRLPK